MGVGKAGLDLHSRPGMDENEGVDAVLHQLSSLPAYAVGEAGLDLHSRPGVDENEGVAAVETGGKQQSTGLLHIDRFKSLSDQNKKASTRMPFCFGGRGGT